MRTLIRWLLRGVLGIAIVGTVAFGVIYGLARHEFARVHELTPAPIEVTPSAALLERGRHLSVTRGCTGCHGEDLGGTVMFENALIGRITAPNLTRLVPTLSDGDLVRAIRHGIKHDGTAMYVMPSSSYFHLDDADLAALVAYLRTAEPVSNDIPSFRFGPLALVLLVKGDFASELEHMPARRYPRPPAAPTPEYGGYVAHTICTACHGQGLRGSHDGSPDLGAVIAAYPEQAFRELMRTGIGVGGQELETMREAATQHLRYLDEDELSGLYAYLRSLGPAPPGPGAVR